MISETAHDLRHSLGEQVRTMLVADPETTVMDYRGRFFSRAETYALARALEEILETAGIDRSKSIGVVVRNRPLHAAVILSLIMGGRPLTTIYAFQSPQALAADVTETRFAAIVADIQDWTDPLAGAARDIGALGICLDLDALDPISLRPDLASVQGENHRQVTGEPGVEILSSGTTGAPKRIVFPFRMLVRAVESVAASPIGTTLEPDIINWPLGGMGICWLVADVIMGRHMTILDKFNVPEWREAVLRHRPKTANGPPAILRMILDANVPREDLASIEYFYGGSAPIAPELLEEFEAAYDARIIWAYGATEFCGTIISWTPALLDQFAESKRGSMGRALPGVTLRVTHVDSGAPLAAGEIGYLEALVPTIGPDWIRTTDLALIDEDEFVFHRGRGDGAILRGGFKVLPEKIVGCLQAHPAVLDAGVVGIDDRRLGQVPVAAVELRSGAEEPTEQALIDHVRIHLPAHSVPTRILILPELPRTASLKVSLYELRRLFGEPAQ